MSSGITEVEGELFDFVKYALHESMLPHHFMPNDVNWRQTRVACEAQKILNKYSVAQVEPKNYTLLHKESYYGERKQKPYTWFQRKLLAWFF